MGVEQHAGKAIRGTGRSTLDLATGRASAVSHNLNGQRLGRKGRDTRDRIIATAHEVLSEQPDSVITLSEVARRASLRMGSLYLYFGDLTELVLAMLEPVMETTEDEYVKLARPYWSDEDLGERTEEFVRAYHAFWVRNSALLHLRNSMSDSRDQRMMMHRIHSAQPLMRLLVAQMGGDLTKPDSPIASMATALMTGLERVATVTTDTVLPAILQAPVWVRNDNLLRSEARLMEMGIRDYRLYGKNAD